MLNKIFVILMIASLMILPVSAAEDAKIILEGEDFILSNLAPITSHTKDANISGSDFLESRMAEGVKPPKDGFFVEYSVQFPSEGAYEIEMVSTPLNSEQASYIGMQINGGDMIPLTGGKLYTLGGVSTTVMANNFFRNRITASGGYKKGENIIRLHLLAPRTSDNRYIFMLDYMQFTKVPWGIESINLKNGAVHGVYEYGQIPEISVNYNNKAEKKTELSYSVTDFWDKEVFSGVKSVGAGESSFSFTPDNLSKGHYTITAKMADSDETHTNYFSIVTPLDERIPPEGTPFAMDTSLAWLVAADTIPDYARVLALAGVEWARDRYRWNTTNPESGKHDFLAGNYDYTFNELAKYGIKILPLSTHTPNWSKENSADALSSDILFAYDYAKESGDYFDGLVQAWEMWNEPELSSTRDYETADRLTALMKALAVGYYDSASKPLVSTPGLAYPPAHFAELEMRNDIMDFCEIYNYHVHLTYNEHQPVLHLPETPPSHMNILSQYGADDKLVWLTEAGTYVPFRAGTSELEYDQQVRYARYLVVSTIESLAAGTDMHYWFVLPYYVEANRMLGTFSRDHTPYSAYSAQAAMTEVVGQGKYLGKLNNLPKGTDGYLFRNNDKQVAVYWSATDTELSLPFSKAVKTDIMGNSEELSGSISFTTSPDPVYITIDGEFPEEMYAKAWVRNPTTEKTFTEAQRVILEQKYPVEVRESSKILGYSIPPDGVTITVEVNNLNPKRMSGVINSEAFVGWQVSPASRKVTVDPFSKKKLSFIVKPSKRSPVNLEAAIKFFGEFDGEKTSNAVTTVFLEGDEKPTYDSYLPGYTEPDKWLLSHSSDGTIEVTNSEKKGEVDFHYTFTGEGDRWGFPKLTMPEGTDFRGTKGILLDFYLPEEPLPGTINRVFINEQNGSRYFNSAGFTLTKGENRIMVPWTHFSAFPGTPDDNFNLDLHLIHQIEVGMNVRAKADERYTLRAVGVYKGAVQDYYTEVKTSAPEDGGVVLEATPVITASFEKKSIDILPETIKVVVDGLTVNHTFDEETYELRAQITEPLSDGEHIAKISYRCQDTKGFLVTNRFSVNTRPIEFTDLDSVSWAKEAILYLTKKNVIDGVGGGLFKPNSEISKAEFIKLVVNTFSLKGSGNSTDYSDVSPEKWYYNPIIQAEGAGLLNGIYIGKMEPEKAITRQDMAAIVHRAVINAGVEMPDISEKKAFTDKDAFAPYAVDPISALSGWGILEGTGGGEFKPQGTATRAEAAKIIYLSEKLNY